MSDSTPPLHTAASPAPRRRWLAALGLLPLLQACSPLALINATVSRSSHRAEPDQAYGPDTRQRLDVYRPLAGAGAASGAGGAGDADGAPLVLFFYGGSWSSGNRQDYRFVGEALAARGIVTLVADYRLSPLVRYPAFVQDSALALRWAMDRAPSLGASPRRVFVMGHSAGAYNAAMLALDPRWLAAVGLRPEQLAGWIGLAGPYDFLPIEAPQARVAFNWPNTPADSQPLFHARRLAPGFAVRTLLLAAQTDRLVDPQINSQALADALLQRQVPVELAFFERVSHVTLVGAIAAPLRGLAPVLDRISSFCLRA